MVVGLSVVVVSECCSAVTGWNENEKYLIKTNENGNDKNENGNVTNASIEVAVVTVIGMMPLS